MLLIEQNARSALSVADQAVVLSLGKVELRDSAERLAGDDALAPRVPGLLTMRLFVIYTVDGITNGMVYAAVALALVMIWRATRIINYAQGAMAMFTTYIALVVIRHGAPYWLGFVVALATGLVSARSPSASSCVRWSRDRRSTR